MAGIVCAIRGGPESSATVMGAIELALDTGACLTFFHIMDAEFLQHATIGPAERRLQRVEVDGRLHDAHLV
ncbi:MAG: hypothetical protein R2844_12790 [Caldilineales bacterium]